MTGARARYAELIHVGVDVSPVPFHRGSYSVDLTYYYRVLADALMGNARPVPILGLGVFSKRIVMYGGSSGAKRFDSASVPLCAEGAAVTDRTGPEAVVEALDPMILSAKLVDTCSCCRCDSAPGDLPDGIFSCFDSELVLSGECKRLYVTLGQFSIVRMQRETQLSVPTYEYCVPVREMSDCADSAEDSSPSEVFSQVEFPVESFFPFGK